MNILITGASGFVGTRLVPALIQAGHQVRCALTRATTQLSGAEQVLIQPLEEQQDWKAALSGIDVVIHLAARVHVMNDKATSPLDLYCKINSTATKHLAEQAAKYQVKRFIFLSSIKVNGEFTIDEQGFHEQCDPQPQDPYGQSKLFAEQYLQNIGQRTGMEIIILRPPLVYGPGVKANFLNMLRWTDKGWPLPFASIKNKRTFIYIDNLVSALCTVVEHPHAANQTYLVADNESWSLAELISELAKAMNVRSPLFAFPVRVLATTFKILRLGSLNQRLFGSLIVSNNKIKSQLDWVPPVSSAEGLNKTAQWYLNEYIS